MPIGRVRLLIIENRLQSISSILQEDEYLSDQNNNRRYLYHRLNRSISDNQILSSKRSIYTNFYFYCDYLFNFLCLSIQIINRQSQWQTRINIGRVRNILISTITTNAKSSGKE